MIVNAKLLIDVSMNIDDAEASEETVKYLVEQDLEDCGFNVNTINTVITCKECIHHPQHSEWCRKHIRYASHNQLCMDGERRVKNGSN